MKTDLRLKSLRDALIGEATQTEVKDIQFVTHGARAGKQIMENLDRSFGAVWDLANGEWKFALVLDDRTSHLDVTSTHSSTGHGEAITVDFILTHYPDMVQSNLIAAVELSAGSPLSDGVVSRVLARPVIELDERIKNDVLSLLPADLEGFDAESVFKDAAGNVIEEVQRSSSGSTLCASLVDPAGRLHVANLGDCSSVLRLPTDSGWSFKDLAPHHRTNNLLEISRIRNEHPEEPECISPDNRLLTPRGGNLSRGLGDMYWKFPVHVTKMLFALKTETHDFDGLKTPPYMSHTPDVLHADVSPGAFLILASDGLEDVAFKHWRMDVAQLVTAANPHRAGQSQIVPLDLLWQVFGGDSDENFYESYLTGEYARGRIDDMTIAVVRL